jgi:hypothetical protein
MFPSNLNPVRMNPRLGYVVGNSETNVALADWSWHVPCAYQCALFATRLESQFVIPGRVAHPSDIWIFAIFGSFPGSGRFVATSDITTY